MLRIVIALIFAFSSVAYGSPEYKEYNPKGVSGGWQEYVTSGGASRCQVKDCICRVSPSKRLPAGSPTSDPERRLSVYFDRDSFRVRGQTVSSIKDFRKHFPNTAFTVIGYTDGCGDMSHNSSLAQKRVEAVKQVLNSGSRVAVTKPIFKPELTKGCSAEARRVDVIAHTKSRLTTMLDKIPADVYLIDASGSMWSDWRSWSDVISASFKPNSRVYLSKTIGCFDGQPMDESKPSGGTEIWYSYWKVLEFMKEGETLVIISDFRSDIPLTERESVRIENKVAAKKVKVFVVQL